MTDMEHVCRIAAHVRAGPGPLRLMAILDRSRLSIVPYDEIMDRYHEMTDGRGEGYMERTHLAGHAKRLRRALRAAGMPVDVQSVYGLGYKITMPDGYAPPWRETAAPQE